MAEIETSHDDAIADLVTFDKEEETVIPAVEKQEMEDNVDDILIPEAAPPPPAAPVDLEPTKEVEESTEILPPTSTPSGVEEVSCPDISSQDTDEAIVDGFPAQTKPQMNGAATTTPSLPTPTTEGFEELTGIDDKPAKKR